MTQIERYIFVEVIKPLAAVLGILIGLFACFSSARYLAEAITETLGIALMLKLVFLKTLIALEVLIPIALYVSILIGLGRMHRDQEIIAIRAAGINGLRIIRAVLWVAVPVGIAVGLLSVIGRPWAYEDSYLLDARANAELNTDWFQAGRFYGNEDSGRVVYIQDKNDSDGNMQNVFHYINRDGSKEIILSRFANQVRAGDDERTELHLLDGTIHRLMYDDTEDEIVKFNKLVLFLDDSEYEIGYKRKAAATTALLFSEQTTDVAELQWRLSRPVATILLALIAIPLSRSSPRQGRGEKIFTAALIFAVYYNLSGLARTGLEQGTVGSFPGIWWLHMLMTIVGGIDVVAGVQAKAVVSMTLLENYIVRQIVSGLFISAAVLLPLFGFLDLIEQLDDVGEGFYRTKDAFLYVGYLVPRRFVQLAPFIALLGTVIGLGRMAVNLELITMRAAGLSPLRISRIVLKVGLFLLIILAVLEQFVAPEFQQKAISHRAEALAQSTELGTDLGTWTRDKRQILRIGESPQGSLMRDIEIMSIDEEGRLQEFLSAEFAEVKTEREWELSNVTKKVFSDNKMETSYLDSMSWQSFLNPEQMSTLNRPAESLSPFDLYKYVKYLSNTGQQTEAYELALWRKLGGGLVTIAMVLLSVPFVFGSVRGGIANRLVLAGVTGICVYLLDQIVANAGLLLNLSFPFVALAPGFILIWLAVAWLQRLP